jgi:hypothetical protein
MSNLPDGAEHDSSAPYNDDDVEGTFEVTVEYSATVSGTTNIKEFKYDIERDMRKKIIEYLEEEYSYLEFDLKINGT